MVANANLSLGLRASLGLAVSEGSFRSAVRAAIANNGRERTRIAHLSPSQGKSQNPAKRGPTMQPVMLTAYAVPARSGSPDDQESTSKGVRNPARAQKSAIEERRSPLNPALCKGSKGSAPTTGITANSASKLHAEPL